MHTLLFNAPLVAQVVLIAGGTGLALFAALGLFTLSQVVFRPRASTEFARTTCTENGEITPEFLARKQRHFFISSPHGYRIHCVEIQSGPWNDTDDTRPVAIFCHGHSWTWHGQIKYMNEYLSRGYRVIAYDHRAHGESGGRACTYGFYEKDDLGAVIDAVTEPASAPVILCGESMGAATILEYRPDDPRIAARVCDCGFSDLRRVLLQHLLNGGLPEPIGTALLSAGSIFCTLFLGFPFSAVSPVRSAEHMSSPVCILHGKLDKTAPVSMAYELFEALRRSPAAAGHELHIFDQAAHAKSIASEPERYSHIIAQFLDRTLALTS